MTANIRLLLLFLATLGLVGCFEEPALEITILHMNDHHSHLKDDTFDYDPSELGLSVTKEDGSVIDSVEVTYGGFPRITTLFNELSATSINPLKIHAGDAITGTLFYSLFEGEADAELMNTVCFDAFALGNHEFDDGDSGLVNFLDFLNSDSCQTPVLAANVVPGPDSPLANDYIQPFIIKEYGDEKVGIIGIDIKDKTQNSSNPDEGTEFLDEIETAQSYIDQLAADGVNKIVLVTHYQYLNDIDLAGALTGVDVIVGGDSHSLLGDDTFTRLGIKDSVSGEYPTIVKGASEQDVCIVQAWEYAHLIGSLSVKFNDEGDVIECTGNPIVPISTAEEYVYEFNDDEERVLDLSNASLITEVLRAEDEIMLVEEDVDAVALIDAFDDEIEVLEQTVIGNVAEDLCLERFPNEGRSSIDGCRASTYNQGSDISNIVAKAFLTVTKEADVAIQNGGGVRVDISAGDFTIADAFTLLPFSNTLVILDMTGQQIIDVLEDALSNRLDDEGSTGSYPYASGLRYDVDASQDEGNRVSNVEINSRVEGEWTSIELDTTYRVVTNNFIASGRDGYATFGEVFTNGLVEDTFTEYAQGMINYVELLTEQGLSLQKLPNEEYSTKSYIGSDGCDHSDPNVECTEF